eukprot:1161066-Pelagomonas_calceolata.AAC.11
MQAPPPQFVYSVQSTNGQDSVESNLRTVCRACVGRHVKNALTLGQRLYTSTAFTEQSVNSVQSTRGQDRAQIVHEAWPDTKPPSMSKRRQAAKAQLASTRLLANSQPPSMGKKRQAAKAQLASTRLLANSQPPSMGKNRQAAKAQLASTQLLVNF